MRVESIEDELEGIRWATASYKKQQLAVEYDETKVGVDKIIDYLRHLGYPASVQWSGLVFFENLYSQILVKNIIVKPLPTAS